MNYPTEFVRVLRLLGKLSPTEKKNLLLNLRSRVRVGTDLSEFTRLTTKQAAVLAYCRTRMIETGRVPTVRQVQAEFGLKSLSTAHTHLQALRAKKLLPGPTELVGLNLIEGQFLFDLIDEQAKEIEHLRRKS